MPQEQLSEVNQEKRRTYVKKRLKWSHSRLLFLDETGVNLQMTRRYARAPKGQRVYCPVPSRRGVNITICAAISKDGLHAPMRMQGAMNGEVFEAYIEQFLLPTLRKGDILIMDNLSVHKRVSLSAIVAKKQAQIVFLPPYSPDLNPIEMMWAKTKVLLRNYAARTPRALNNAIKKALLQISKQEIRNYIKHAGYYDTNN